MARHPPVFREANPMALVLVAISVAGAACVAIVIVRIVRPALPGDPTRRGTTGDPTGDPATSYFGPSILQFPGRCFRLCRDVRTGAAYPCPNEVVATGEVIDYRGNVVAVQSCDEHADGLEGSRRR
jgi:hypothetical protein